MGILHSKMKPSKTSIGHCICWVYRAAAPEARRYMIDYVPQRGGGSFDIVGLGATLESLISMLPAPKGSPAGEKTAFTEKERAFREEQDELVTLSLLAPGVWPVENTGRGGAAEIISYDEVNTVLGPTPASVTGTAEDRLLDALKQIATVFRENDWRKRPTLEEAKKLTHIEHTHH